MDNSFTDGIVGRISLFLGGTPAAPVFMAVMGYFIARSKRSLSSGIERGAALFFGGIVLNLFLNASLLYRFFTSDYQGSAYDAIFAFDILQLAGLSIIILSLLKHFAKGQKSVSYILFLILILLNQIVPRTTDSENVYWRFLLSYLFTNEPWSFFPLLPWLIYPLAGYIYNSIEEKIKLEKRLNPFIPVLVQLALVFTGGKAIEITANLPEYYHHNIYLIIWNLVFIAVYWYLVKIIAYSTMGNPVMNWIKWLGRNVTAVFVIQWIIIGNTGTILYKSLPGTYFLLIVAAMLALTTLVTYGWLFIKPGLVKD